MILGANRFACKRFCCSHLRVHGCTRRCECVPPLPSLGRGSPKSCLCGWSGCTSAVLAKPRAAACKRKTVVLPTVPCPGGIPPAPRTQGKAKGGRIEVFSGPPSPAPKFPACPGSGLRLHSATPQAATNSPCCMVFLLRPQSFRSLPRSPSAREPPKTFPSRAQPSQTSATGRKRKFLNFTKRALERRDTAIDTLCGKGGTVSPCVPHGHCKGEACPG